MLQKCKCLYYLRELLELFSVDSLGGWMGHYGDYCCVLLTAKSRENEQFCIEMVWSRLGAELGEVASDTTRNLLQVYTSNSKGF